jgi:L-ascorbate metabolism protein UlaG (beta-lactamase superfamily)
MELQLIRSATIKIKYAGKTILVDLCFPQNTSAPFAIARNPTVDLTVSIDTILKIWILLRIPIPTILTL